MEKYVLTIRVPIDAIDDPDARQKSQKKLKDMGIEIKDDIKLQEVIDNKPPRKINLK
jgi:hypothetical protein